MSEKSELYKVHRKLFDKSQQQKQPCDYDINDAPDLATIQDWVNNGGGCEATDGCWVEPDGICPHGCQSWLLVLGLI